MRRIAILLAVISGLCLSVAAIMYCYEARETVLGPSGVDHDNDGIPDPPVQIEVTDHPWRNWAPLPITVGVVAAFISGAAYWKSRESSQ